MSSSRIPPIPPNKGGELDKTAPTSSHRRVEKVEKVSEVDDESLTRQRFRQFVDAEDEEESNLPTPFSIFSKEPGTAPTGGLGSPLSSQSFEETALPSPTYSPPPATFLDDTALQDEEETPPLPQSDQFWEGVEEPTQYNQLSMQPQMEETPNSASRIFVTSEDTYKTTKEPSSQEESQESPAQGESRESPQGKAVAAPEKKRKGARLSERSGQSKGTQPPSPFELPGAPPMGGKAEKDKLLSGKTEGSFPAKGKKGEEDLLPHPAFMVSKKEEIQSSLYFREEKEKRRTSGPEGVIAPQGDQGIKYIGPLSPEEARYDGRLPPEERVGHQLARSLREEEEQPADLSKRLVEDREKRKKLEAQETALGGPTSKEEEEGGKNKKKSRQEEAESLQMQSPSTETLPSYVIPVAGAAATAAQPYLGFEALSIYYHMIGTITAMVSPKGDSRTEFILNAPSFANSKFYGATISIEKFSTAPYQLNIRLTGSNEAVAAFNQNIPNLLAAFQAGKFSYTVNRIEAAYEKPLFQRKESTGEKGQKGGGAK